MKKKYWISTFNNQKNLNLINDLHLLLNDWEYTENNFEYLFLLGGDGTFIKQLKKYFLQNIKIIPINSGTNTFMGIHSIQEIKDNILPNINQDDLFSVYQVLKLQNEKEIYYGINDIFIFGNLFLECDVYINDWHFQIFKGYSLLFSSLLGCTALNKSSFTSPLIIPSLQSWIMSQLFPQTNNKINNLINPIIFSENEIIKLKILSMSSNIFIDNEKIDMNGQLFNISIIKSKAKIYFPTKNLDYLKKIKNHFIK